MPNLKVFVDDEALPRGLPAAGRNELRQVLIEHLNVPLAACQVAVVPVQGLPDQPLANIELSIMQHPDRTKEALSHLGAALQAVMRSHADVHSAFRCTLINPEAYVAMK
ncbi:MAG: hypothetical protein AAFQ58_01635 [Pseudomonadota bacterium]